MSAILHAHQDIMMALVTSAHRALLDVLFVRMAHLARHATHQTDIKYILITQMIFVSRVLHASRHVRLAARLINLKNVRHVNQDMFCRELLVNLRAVQDTMLILRVFVRHVILRAIHVRDLRLHAHRALHHM